jgi:arylsulfatase A-like enzyme
MRSQPHVARWALLAGLALAAACDRGRKDVPPPAEARAGPPNVVLVVVDTERVDATSLAGAGADATPALTGLAAGGITFRNAYAPGPWTVPSMYSLMTGLYPGAHGIDFGVVGGKGRLRQPALSPQVETLAKALKAAGYATHAINTNLHTAARFGLGSGFDTFVGDGFRDLPFPSDEAKELLPRIAADPRPYFLWIHYFDPHYPYTPHEPWFTRFDTSGLSGFGELSTAYDWRAAGIDPAALKDPENVPLAARLKLYAVLSGQLAAGDAAATRVLAFLRAAYRSEIAYTDRAVGELLVALPRPENTMVVYVSDHGEELFEHGLFTHKQPGGHLFDELLRVPFVVRLPRGERAGTAIDAPVSLVDVLPTVLELAGRKAPEGLGGESLVPLLRGGSIPARALFAETTFDRETSRAILRPPWKLVRNGADGSPALYDTSIDPGERTDLSVAEPERTKALEEELDAFAARTRPLHQPTPAPVPSDGERARLEALGYIE